MAEGTPMTLDDKPITVDRRFLIDRQGKSFVLYAGLLDAAHRAGLESIATEVLQFPSEANGQTCIVRAIVRMNWVTPHPQAGTRPPGLFSGIGDASPGNVGRNIAAHFIRMSETRAKARALRDAINVGTAAIEELGEDEDGGGLARPNGQPPPAGATSRPPPATPPSAVLPASMDGSRLENPQPGPLDVRDLAASIHARMRAIKPTTAVELPPADSSAMEFVSFIDTYGPLLEEAEARLAAKGRAR